MKSFLNRPLGAFVFNTGGCAIVMTVMTYFWIATYGNVTTSARERIAGVIIVTCLLAGGYCVRFGKRTAAILGGRAAADFSDRFVLVSGTAFYATALATIHDLIIGTRYTLEDFFLVGCSVAVILLSETLGRSRMTRSRK